MLYALLTTISALHPTVTPIPTATPTPIPFAISIEKNITDLPWGWEIAGILLSVVLGAAALLISINANRFAKHQQQREEAMREFEHRLAAYEKITYIHNFFKSTIQNVDFFMGKNYQTSRDEINSVRSAAFSIFKDDVYAKIENELNIIEGYLHPDKMLKEEQKLINEAKEGNKKITDEVIQDYRKNNSGNNFNTPVFLLHTIMSKRIEEILKKYRLNL